MRENAAHANRPGREVLLADFPAEHEPCPAGSDRALDSAIMTPRRSATPS